MDQLASVSSLPASRKRARASSLPRISQPKRPRIEDWIEETVTSRSLSGKEKRTGARSDSELDLSVGFDRLGTTTCSERPRLNRGVLGPTLSDSSFDSNMSESFGSEKNVVKTTDPRYKECLTMRNISEAPTQVPKPLNWDTIIQAMNKKRPSPGPDDNTANLFCKRVPRSNNEGGALQALLPILLPIIDKFWDCPDDSPFVNQQWDRLLLLRKDLEPRIAPPQPDQVFGFSEGVFDFPQARLHKGYHMCPAPELIWPYFTIEAKGWRGVLRVAELQNAHNGAIMVNNMFQLKVALGKEQEFYDRIQAVTMDLTTESIAFSGHFLTKSSTGLKYYSQRLAPVESTQNTDGFKKSYARGMNLVEHMRQATEAWIRKDMEELERKLDQGIKDGLAIRPSARAQTKGSGVSSRRGNSKAKSKSRTSKPRGSNAPTGQKN